MGPVFERARQCQVLEWTDIQKEVTANLAWLPITFILALVSMERI